MRRSCWFYKVLSNKVLTYIYDLILPLSENPLGTIIHLFRTATEVIFKKVFLKISKHSQGNTFVRVFSLIQLQGPACNFIKKETLAQVFSCKLCETFKSTFFTKHLWATASVYCFSLQN